MESSSIMDAQQQQPLLLLVQSEGSGKHYSASSFALKWSLRAAMWLIFLAWAAFLFLYPSQPVSHLFQQWRHATQGSPLGTAGSIFAVFGAPILVIAFLATAYLYLCGEDQIHGKKSPQRPRLRLWTFPILVDGPFGVVSAAEVIGIVVFATYIVWAVWAETLKNFEVISLFNVPTKDQSVLWIELTGLRLGLVGLFCMVFLFLPVARGSVLLRLVDIPFEHATRYHVWLGHLTMLLFTLHGLLYVIAWAIKGHLIYELMQWKHHGIANLPGVISLAAGLLMWVTSLPGLRRINFELFFYTHQLYVVFVVFLVMHVGDFIFCYAAAPVFLFMLDRFLRFCQSRKTVDVLSATTFPCGTLELVLSKPANLHYNALGWIFLQVRELSWLQWHPFSVSSSPLDGKHHLAILIKVLGDWTQKLDSHISNSPKTGQLLQDYSKLTVSVEGPYGHESPYHLTYENLILVAGGIGISPFLAILSDILHRIHEGKPCLPKNVLLIWAVKKSNELPLLQSLDMESTCPKFSDTLNLEIQTYVTRESEPSLEDGKPFIEPPAVFPASTSRGCGMSALVGTGHIVWSGAYVIASTVGLVITVGLLNVLYINPYEIDYWWYKGLLLLACMTVSIVLFGGAVIGLWQYYLGKKTEESAVGDPPQSSRMYKTSATKQYANTTLYGQRPDFAGIFERMSDRWGKVDIGVIVCGPPTLQTSVAKECRTQNLGRRADEAVFHFNSHTFDL